MAEPGESSASSSQAPVLTMTPPVAHSTASPGTNAAFIGFLSSSASTGSNGLEREEWYIAFEKLEDHWTEAVIEAHLSAPPERIPASAARILQLNLIRVWSILVYIGYPECIVSFITPLWDDYNLPMDPSGGPSAVGPSLRGPDFEKMLAKFRKFQWHFAPVCFQTARIMDGRRLDDRCILPIDSKSIETLTSPIDRFTTTVVRRVRLNRDCSDLPNNTVIFKEYQTEDGRQAWEREVHLFLAPGVSSCGEIVKYFGSFAQHNKFVLVLESANVGSLLDIFKSNQQPRTLEQATKYWESLMRLLFGLDQLHHLHMAGGSHLGCQHRDIKPANILVFREEGAGPFDFTLKLTDFDTSTGPQRIMPNGAGVQNRGGSCMYCAMESARFYPEQADYNMETPLDCDVWSLGCVLSECLVWMGGGEEARLEYEQRRREETSTVPGIPGSGYDLCFHNGVTALRCVRAVHDETMMALKRFDTVSPVIRNVVDTMMMRPHKQGRLQAMDVYHQYQILLREQSLTSEKPPQSPTSPGGTQLLASGLSAPGPLTSSASSSNGLFSPTSPTSSLQHPMSSPSSRPSYGAPGMSFRSDLSHQRNSSSLSGASWASASTPASAGTGRHHTTSPARGLVPSLQHASSSSTMETHATLVRSGLGLQPEPGYHSGSAVGLGSQVPLERTMPTSPADMDHTTSASASNGEWHNQRTQSPPQANGGYSAVALDRHPKPNVSFPPTSTGNTMTVSQGKQPERPESRTFPPFPVRPGQPSSEGESSEPFTDSKTSTQGSREAQRRPMFPLPNITVDQVLEWKKSKKSKSTPLEGLTELRRQLRGRDQIFLVDDSRSMRDNYPMQVIRTAKALMHLVKDKDIDPDGIELRIASRPDLCFKSYQVWGRKRATTGLVDTVRKYMEDSDATTCNMERVLNEVISHAVRRGRQTSIFILTDGVWEANDKPGGGVENSIETLASIMRRRGLTRTHFGLQFVQFGKEEVGTSRMRYLDNELSKEGGVLQNFDFVDHRRHTESVYHILLCATSTAIDQYHPDEGSGNGESSAAKARGEG